MGLFRKDQEQERPVNPNNLLMIRVLAIGYLLYSVYSMIDLYIKGGEDAPSLWLLIAAIVLFVGGSVWIGVSTYKQYKQLKAEQQAAWEEEERLTAEVALQEGEEDGLGEIETAEESVEEPEE